MIRWKYKLEDEGQKLRCLINKEDTIETIVSVYNQMEVCLKLLLNKMVQRDIDKWKYDIDALIEDIQMSCPDIEDPGLIYNDEEAILNSHLKEFYDLCDAIRVWIGLDVATT